MAKKLYVGNYTFDASEQVVSVSGNVAAEKFLIITNITSNTIIYNFADALLGYAGKFYNISTDKTEFSLIYDTTSMNDTDVLQIFIDQDYQEITQPNKRRKNATSVDIIRCEIATYLCLP